MPRREQTLCQRNSARCGELVFLYNEFFSLPNESLRSLAIWILFDLFYQSTMPVAKRQAWTTQQRWYAIELTRKSPDKKLDGIIVAINHQV
jgi:hypothetical protein